MFEPEATNPTPTASEGDEVAVTEERLGLSDDHADPVDETADAPEVVEEESEEVEHEGKKYSIPKPLKSALMFQQDYTRKTQEVAEQRRALEAQQQQFQQARQTQQQHLKEYAQLTAIDSQLEAYQNVNWQQLNQEDPIQAQQHWMTRTQLQEQRQALANNLTQREQQALNEQRQNDAKRIQEGREMLAREIKDWSPDLAKKLTDYGTKLGYSEQELQGVQDARAIRLLHKAWQFDQMAAKAAKPPSPAAPAAKPSSQIPAGKSTVLKPLWDADQKEFEARRRKQIAARS